MRGLPYYVDTPEAKARFRRRIIPRGTVLFRAADSLANMVPEKIAAQFNECTDTGKRGLYFATYPLLSMAIATEYHRDMLMGVFEVQEDIVAADGKYEYRRLILPPNGPENDAEFKLMLKMNPIPEKMNINHFDDEMLPILLPVGSNDFADEELPWGTWSAEGWAGELFLAKPEDRAKVKLVDAYIVRHDKVCHIARELNYQVDANSWESSQTWLNYLENTKDLRAAAPPKPPAVGALRAGAVHASKKKRGTRSPRKAAARRASPQSRRSAQ